MSTTPKEHLPRRRPNYIRPSQARRWVVGLIKVSLAFALSRPNRNQARAAEAVRRELRSFLLRNRNIAKRDNYKTLYSGL